MVNGSPGAMDETSGVRVAMEEVRCALAKVARARRIARKRIGMFLAVILVVSCDLFTMRWVLLRSSKNKKKPQGKFPAALVRIFCGGN